MNKSSHDKTQVNAAPIVKSAEPSGPPTKPWKDWAPLALLIVTYLIFAYLHIVSTPTGATGYQDAPDEAAHVSYVQSVALGHFPSKAQPHAGTQNSYPDYEWHQPPLYYLLAVPFLAGGERGVRVLSVLLGIGSILFVYRITCLLRPRDRYTPLVAAGICALTPGHIAINSSVNNDSLLELAFCATLYCLISLVVDIDTGDITVKRACLTGLCLGIGLVTKTTALLLIPVVITVGAILVKLGKPRREVARYLAITGTTALLISGWWFVRNVMLYHEPLPLHAFQKSFGGTALAREVVQGGLGLNVHGWPEYWQKVIAWCFSSFWAVYGTPRSAVFGVPLYLPDFVYYLLAMIVIATVAGMGRLHFKRDTLFTVQCRYALYVLFVTLGLVGTAYALFVSQYFQTQGRYLYPAMSAIAPIIAVGWLAHFPARYEKSAAVGLLVFLFLTTALFSVTTEGRSQLPAITRRLNSQPVHSVVCAAVFSTTEVESYRIKRRY